MRGSPDYGNAEYSIAVQQNDLALLSVIMGGYSFLDGRGRIVWYDNFMQGLIRWICTQSGNGLLPFHTFNQTKTYGFYGSAQLDPTDVNGVSKIQTEVIIPKSRYMGVEVYVTLQTTAGWFDLFMYVGTANNSGRYMQLRIKPDTREIIITSSGVNHTVFTPTNVMFMENKWMNIKIVGDFENNTYYRLIVGNTQIDVSSFATTAFTGILEGYVSVIIIASGGAGLDVDEFNIGGVAITTDEP